MKKRRFCAALLAAALTCGLFVTGSTAVTSSFRDVTDPKIAVNADVLRLMGVVDGVGDNAFQPSSTLSRAEFCVMVTNFIQRGEEVSRYASRTIFHDVTGKHWARGYINLMATPVNEQPAMISGIGNGSFAPGNKVTVAQAVTVLLRVLGYTSEQTGSIWPQSYMDLAQSIDLLTDVPTDPYAVITRAQAAQLFVNALGCPTQNGQDYYKTLGNAFEDVILLAVNVTTDDNSSDHAIRTSLNGEAFLAASGDVAPRALQGKRGALVFNDQEEIVAFLPDDSNSMTITLSGDAQPSYLKGTDGQRYTMSSSTILYTADQEEGSSYIEGYTTLQSGTQVTLFTKSGKITAVYAAGNTNTLESSAVIVQDKASYPLFHRLTDGASNCTILKNRQPISMEEIEPFDVVTYDTLNNTLVVSDLRLVGIYEDAYPNASAPETITALGTEFEVLDSAWETMDNIKIGNTVCLLLTADGKVAGIMTPNAKRQANAVAYVNSGSVEVFLPNGATLSLQGSLVDAEKSTNQLVTVSSSKKGTIKVSALSGKKSHGDLDTTAMTVGSLPISGGVRIYDRVKDAPMVKLSLDDLPEIVPSNQISVCHANTSGYVDFLVLENVTGDCYHYGICDLQQSGDGGRALTLENGLPNGINAVPSNFGFEDNQFAGVTLGANGKVNSLVSMTEVAGTVSPSDFFERQGVTYVTVDGKVYTVSDEVVCYKAEAKTWFSQDTGSARLAACKAFSNELTLYCDPFVGQVRIVVAK